MAHSRIPGPFGAYSRRRDAPEPVPEPLGVHAHGLYADSPGPVGSNDWAEFAANGYAGPRSFQVGLGSCACGRDLSLRELRKIYSHQARTTCEAFLPYLNATFKGYKIDTCMRKAHFLAQVAAESGELRYTVEQVSQEKAEKIYRGYQGRGLIQLTFEKNYERYGEAVHHDFLDRHKADLEKPQWAANSAGWYWTSGSSQDLNALADRGDLLAISAHINGGFNGFDERRTHLLVALKVLRVRECKTTRMSAQDYQPYKDSRCHESMIQSFAWGAWNDPAAKKKGIAQPSIDDRKAGYARYLELRAKSMQKPHPQEMHYGFKIADMDQMATQGAR